MASAQYQLWYLGVLVIVANIHLFAAMVYWIKTYRARTSRLIISFTVFFIIWLLGWCVIFSLD